MANKRNRPLGRKTDRGIALIAVLCLLSLLTMLALSGLEASRGRTQMARESFETIQARELADSAIRLTLLELGASATPVSVGATRTVDVFGQRTLVTLQVEAGRIDLNAANEDLLTAALAGNGFQERSARSIAARIVDWRDADDLAGSGGAERDEYRRAGWADGPRNGELETISELSQILGMDQLERDLPDVFTVYSHSADVRQSAASGPVIRALRWADARQIGGRHWWREDVAGRNRLAETTSLVGEAVRIRACTGAPRQPCRVAIVRFTGSEERPVMVFAWYTDAGAEDDPDGDGYLGWQTRDYAATSAGEFSFGNPGIARDFCAPRRPSLSHRFVARTRFCSRFANCQEVRGDGARTEWIRRAKKFSSTSRRAPVHCDTATRPPLAAERLQYECRCYGLVFAVKDLTARRRAHDRQRTHIDLSHCNGTVSERAHRDRASLRAPTSVSRA